MSKYIKGLVSIVIPTYKRSDMLLRAIESACSQTYKNIEVLVVDDNIAGDQYAIELRNKFENIKDNRVFLVEQEKHINGAAARNAGIRRAKGEYIAFLDDDDFIVKNKIEIQVKELERLDTSWGAVSCLKKIYKNGKFVKATIPYRDGEIFEDIVSFMTNITTGTALIRREALDAVGYWDESLRRNQDIQLFSFLSNKYKIRLINKYLLLADISDEQNRVSSIADYMKIKEAFYQSVMPLMKVLSAKKRNKVESIQKMFVGVHYLRNDHKRIGVRMILESFKERPATLLSFVKYGATGVLEAKAGKIICNMLEKNGN